MVLVGPSQDLERPPCSRDGQLSSLSRQMEISIWMKRIKDYDEREFPSRYRLCPSSPLPLFPN